MSPVLARKPKPQTKPKKTVAPEKKKRVSRMTLRQRAIFDSEKCLCNDCVRRDPSRRAILIRMIVELQKRNG